MEIAQAVPIETDFGGELLAAYPVLVRRLAFVLRDWDQAQDVAQSAFARALEQRSRFRGGEVRAWFLTLGVRLGLNELRRRRRRPAVALQDDAPVWATETDADLWAALAHLEPRQRAALILSSVDGYTHAEIGLMLGVRTGTVSSWLSRSKEMLREELGVER